MTRDEARREARDALYDYYDRELRFIRKQAWQFATRYRKEADQLLIEENDCKDPHVRRLIQAFAMLTARIHQRLDDDFSEVTDALLGVLYPHLLCPIPSMTIVQVLADPDASAKAGGLEVPRHSLMHARPNADGVHCGFRTAYPLRLFPLEVTAVEHTDASLIGAALPDGAHSGLRIQLRTRNQQPLRELAIDALRFFVDGSGSARSALYEALLRDPLGLRVRGDRSEAGVLLGPEAIRPVGFERDEGLLEYTAESFLGYRLLQEYFAFPEKFFFVELVGLAPGTARSAGDTLELVVFLREATGDLDLRVEPGNLKLGCTPAVNLFPHRAEPIRLTHASVEYKVEPDVRAPLAHEVYAITSVSTPLGDGTTQEFRPFYALSAGRGREQPREAYWYAVRRPSLREGDVGSDVFVSVVDSDFRPAAAEPEEDRVLRVTTLCTNRALAGSLPVDAQFKLVDRPGVARVVSLRKPSEPRAVHTGSGSRWRLISHLRLNYLSLFDDASRAPGGAAPGHSALAALREILGIYDFDGSAAARQPIEGLVDLRSRLVVRRLGRGAEAAFARGVELDLELDPRRYTGTGAFLFASVLERFLGLYTTLNSFTQTVARLRQREGVLKRWPPRAGAIPLT